MTAAARNILVGSPEPLPVWVSVHGADEHGRPQAKALFHVSAMSRESAWALIAADERFPLAEVVYFDERGTKTHVYRDASSRQWRRGEHG